jgi:hypothetical protein
MQTMTSGCAKCRAGGSAALEAFEAESFAFEAEETFGAFEQDELDELDGEDELDAEDELADEGEFNGEDELGRRTPGRSSARGRSKNNQRSSKRAKSRRPGRPGRGLGGIELGRPVRCVCPSYGTEYVRWIQSALNQLQGLRLPVSGVMDAATRSALRSFQRSKGVPPDGIAGPDTEQALREARRPAGSAAPAAEPQPEPAADSGEAEALEALGLHESSESNEEVSRAALRLVKDFSGPAAECTAALRRAGKTKAQALSLINARVAVAIALLRKAASNLQRGNRSAKTRALFVKIFRVTPEFVPTWLKTTSSIQDRGDVVATRCRRVADLLASGTLKYFCAINPTNCPDCPGSSDDFACSSWGDESQAPKNSRVVCLGGPFWDDMKAGRAGSMISTLAHEPFHIFYGKHVTVHDTAQGKFGGINCIVRFVFETNGRAAPARVNDRCTSMVVRKEVGFS